MTAYRVSEIAAALGAEALGAVDLSVTGLSEPAEAGPQDLALAMRPAYIADLAKGQARVALLASDTDWQALDLEAAIRVGRPRYALATLTRMMDAPPIQSPGVHASAVVDPSARLGPNAAVGALTVIEAGARIGPNATIGPQVFIGAGARIGAEALIHAGVRIGANVTIGDRVILQPGCVLGGRRL